MALSSVVTGLKTASWNLTVNITSALDVFRLVVICYEHNTTIHLTVLYVDEI